MPWKNGGGETIEIAIAPAGATLDNFEWRISMAHVGASGPFSIFPGIDRTLAVIEGDGIVLHPAGRGDVRLDTGSVPYAFPADLAVDATLIDGAIDDLNVMTRRGRYRHLLSRLHLGAPAVLPRHGETTIVLTHHIGATIRLDAETAALAPGDGIVLTGSDAPQIGIDPDGAGAFYAIDLWRAD
jgi:environmental stress-induced protein Ves